MLASFETYINKDFQFLKDSKLLIACSGGVDSIVLAHLVAKMKLNVAIAHCNFSLRGSESDADAAFVEAFAKKLRLAYHEQRFDTKLYAKENTLSTQMAARELRYTWFNELSQAHGYHYILTAHHQDDDIETFFINLSRGTGLRGLTGIPPINNTIIRPLLPFSKTQILVYAKQQELHWRDDSSNAKTEYLRNKLRIEVLPALIEISKQTRPNFRKTQQHLQASQALVEDYMALIYNLVVTEVTDGYSLNIPKFLELPNTQALLYELLHPFGFTAWNDVYKLLTAQTGKEVVSSSHRLLRNRNELLITEIDKNEAAKVFFIKKNETAIDTPIQLRFIPTNKIGNIENTNIYVDADLLSYPLTLRKWKKGDVFQPFGMQGKKKLSKFFKDEKLSLIAKQKVWLLCSEDKIVWVVGLRLDERFKITPQTKQLLKITTRQ